MKKKLSALNGLKNNRSRFSDERDSWLISFSDIITMLLCFFMLFYSNKEKNNKSELETLAIDLSQKFGQQVLKDMKEGDVRQIIEKQYGLSGLYNSLLKLESDKEAKVLNFRDHISIEFPKGNMFASGSQNLLPDAKIKLKNVIEELGRYRGKVNMTVVAYTDPSPVIPSNYRWWNSNEELSALRALQTQKLFLENGFLAEDIFIMGKGVRKFSTKEPTSLIGERIDLSRFNQLRTIAIRIEAKE